MTREELRAQLREHIQSMPASGFRLAFIHKPRFGIVDRDRADFLGLQFDVDILYSGAATLWLPEQESLAMMRTIGQASNLEGRLCWVYVEGPGACPAHFVALYGDEYPNTDYS